MYLKAVVRCTKRMVFFFRLVLWTVPGSLGRGCAMSVGLHSTAPSTSLPWPLQPLLWTGTRWDLSEAEKWKAWEGISKLRGMIPYPLPFSSQSTVRFMRSWQGRGTVVVRIVSNPQQSGRYHHLVISSSWVKGAFYAVDNLAAVALKQGERSRSW